MTPIRLLGSVSRMDRGPWRRVSCILFPGIARYKTGLSLAMLHRVNKAEDRQKWPRNTELAYRYGLNVCVTTPTPKFIR